MPASVTNPADVLNLALRRIGYKLHVASLFDGSFAAQQTLDIYAQTRDALLRDGEWAFAQRNIQMTLLKSAPAGGYIPGVTPWTAAYPPLPWLFEYRRPSDCLKVRAVKPTPLLVPNFDPQNHVFTVANDHSIETNAQVILCNVPDAMLVYTGQVTDPTAWEPDFVEAFAAALGQRLMPVLGSLQGTPLATADAQRTQAVAELEQG